MLKSAVKVGFGGICLHFCWVDTWVDFWTRGGGYAYSHRWLHHFLLPPATQNSGCSTSSPTFVFVSVFDRAILVGVECCLIFLMTSDIQHFFKPNQLGTKACLVWPSQIGYQEGGSFGGTLECCSTRGKGICNLWVPTEGFWGGSGEMGISFVLITVSEARLGGMRVGTHWGRAVMSILRSEWEEESLCGRLWQWSSSHSKKRGLLVASHSCCSTLGEAVFSRIWLYLCLSSWPD